MDDSFFVGLDIGRKLTVPYRDQKVTKELLLMWWSRHRTGVRYQCTPSAIASGYSTAIA